MEYIQRVTFPQAEIFTCIQRPEYVQSYFLWVASQGFTTTIRHLCKKSQPWSKYLLSNIAKVITIHEPVFVAIATDPVNVARTSKITVSWWAAITRKTGSWIVITLAMSLSKYLDQGCDFLQRCLMVGVMPYSKKIKLGIFGLWMLIDISACGNISCWEYSNENVSGQFTNWLLKREKWQNQVRVRFPSRCFDYAT